ncbi:LUD domain-containing protein [Dactylosporangium fulvum]|uniref:LUD domain-containing protein n=1 Tax=Dactylosporangium fulvum TaxID=53359 RepID=A0ABY5VUQ0_9ACTN|nr:LUD domain-containing protein [Dactylosporangium fulvum]UWP80922.1 LUD domain-containing protein [Dactylosporangium fulvum]
MTARDDVLARIRTALGPAPVVPETPRDYRRAGSLPPGDPALLEQLVDRLEDYKATVIRTSPAALPADLRSTLAGALPAGGRLIVPPGLPPEWGVEGAVVDDGTLDAAALDGIAGVLTACAAAVAETGTIALDGGPDQGRRAITLVPDRHFCVVRADQVVQTVPDLLARLTPTNPLTLISGPSATSDIELNRVEGVHGPRTLVVLLVHPE